MFISSFQGASWNAIKAVMLQTGLLWKIFIFLVSKWNGHRLPRDKSIFFPKGLHMNFSLKAFLACQLEPSSNMVVPEKKIQNPKTLEGNVSSPAVESLFKIVV